MKYEMPCTFIYQDKDGKEQRKQGTIAVKAKPAKGNIKVVWVPPAYRKDSR